MISITTRAASAIADTCDSRIVPDGGLRIARKALTQDGPKPTLVVEFVDRPRSDDVVVRSGDARVFLADGVEELIGERVLDADSNAVPPRFVLRARRPPASESA
jgi:Fe-S cluster assembly iron-binding protein IscA